MEWAIHGVSQRLEITHEFGDFELHFCVFEMLVVRNHDFALWVVDKPQIHSCFIEYFDPNNLINLHIHIFSELQWVVIRIVFNELFLELSSCSSEREGQRERKRGRGQFDLRESNFSVI